MRQQLCLVRYCLLYSTLCGLALVTVAFYDISLTTNMVVPSFQPILGDLSRFVLLERLSFCSVNNEELSNESEPQTLVMQQQQQSQKDEMKWLKFDPNKSTEENYAANNDKRNNHARFMGRFASIRQRLDYSYHRVYTAERQRLQDVILSGMLDKTQRLACTGQQHHSAAIRDNQQQQQQDLQDQWIIFTAGVMGECIDRILRGIVSRCIIRHENWCIILTLHL